MHNGRWFAWAAARQYRDRQLNPDKYAEKKRLESGKKMKANWTYEKIMFMAHQNVEVPVGTVQEYENLVGKKVK